MSTAASAIFLVGRILFVALFVVSAQGHIQGHARFVATAQGRIPVPYVAGWPVGAWLVLAIISIVLGIWPDVGALMIAAFLIPTTILFHPFWTFSDATQRRTQRGASSVTSVSLAPPSPFSPSCPSSDRECSRSQAPYSTCAEFRRRLDGQA